MMNNYYQLNNTTGNYCDSGIGDIYKQSNNILFENQWNTNNKSVIIINELNDLLNKSFDDLSINEKIPELDMIKNIINEFNIIKSEFIDIYSKLQTEKQNTEKDLELLNSNVKHLNLILKKYKKEDSIDENTKMVVNKIDELSIVIKNNNNLQKITNKYEEINKKLNKYFDIIKVFNNFNRGTVCSMCLQNNVDHYFNPCGHTACNECIKKLKSNSDTYNCIFCKKDIISTKPLYFI